MADNVVRSAGEVPKPEEIDDMMAGWEQVGPWYSRGMFWLGVLVSSNLVVVVAVEMLAAGV